MPDVLPKRVDETKAARLPAVDGHRVDATELATRTASRFGGRYALSHEISGVGVDVETQLVGEIVLEPAPADESGDE
jgi:hypothetical protein